MSKTIKALAVLVCSLWLGASWASAQSFRFVAWGDSRGNSSGVNTSALSGLSNQVNGLSPRPVFTLFAGDLCYTWDSTCTSTGSSGWKYAINNGSPGNGRFHITFAIEGNHDDDPAGWDSS